MIQKGPLKSILSSHYSSPANRPLWRVPLNNAHSWFAGCVLVLGDEAHRENTTEGKHDRGLLMGRTGRGVCLVYSWQRPCRCHLLSPRRGNWSGLMGKYAQGEDGSPEKFEQSAVIDLWQLSGERKDEGDEESFSTEVQWSSYRKENKNAGWTSGENVVVWLPLQQGLPTWTLILGVTKRRFNVSKMPNVRTPKLFS